MNKMLEVNLGLLCSIGLTLLILLVVGSTTYQAYAQFFPDRDGDMIEDSVDDCPDDYLNVCPPDGDRDGIPTFQDVCPDDPYNSCPATGVVGQYSTEYNTYMTVNPEQAAALEQKEKSCEAGANRAGLISQTLDCPKELQGQSGTKKVKEWSLGGTFRAGTDKTPVGGSVSGGYKSSTEESSQTSASFETGGLCQEYYDQAYEGEMMKCMMSEPGTYKEPVLPKFYQDGKVEIPRGNCGTDFFSCDEWGHEYKQDANGNLIEPVYDEYGRVVGNYVGGKYESVDNSDPNSYRHELQ